MTVSDNNPTISSNPNIVPESWINRTTGEEFVCIDNTPGANVWVGQMGTTVGPT